jgi:hypothetical protein
LTRAARNHVIGHLTRNEHQLLAGAPKTATLVDEIEYLRGRIHDAQAPASSISQDQVLRMLELLTRMVSVQAKIGGHDSGSELADLNELVRQRLVKAGWKAESTD